MGGMNVSRSVSSALPDHPTEVIAPMSSTMSLLACTQLPPISHIGNTPLIRLRKVTEGVPARVAIYAKAEHLNPSGSVKDRTALQIIVEAIRSGELHEGKTLIDSTSGNTGISYAMIGAALGIPVEIAMPENASEERKQTLQSYGARLTLTDPDLGSDGAQCYVRDKLAEDADGYYYADQYNNDANWRAHYGGTGQEIIEQTQGRVTHFVAGVGTTGTFVGASRRLKTYRDAIVCAAVQPEDPQHVLKGLRHMETALIPGIYDPTLSDLDLRCSDEEAYDMTRRLAREEGLLVGISSGANVVASIQLAHQLTEGVIVTILCDSGNRYLSQSFWV
jgi:S-sulfo-L-cysteine synthase (O-acetyl-L-serine-dependent)